MRSKVEEACKVTKHVVPDFADAFSRTCAYFQMYCSICRVMQLLEVDVNEGLGQQSLIVSNLESKAAGVFVAGTVNGNLINDDVASPYS